MTAPSTPPDDGMTPELDDRALLSNVSGMVFRAYADRPWQMLYASAGIQALTGHPAAYFIEGPPWGSVMHEDDVERVEQELGAQAAAGQPMRTEYRIHHRDGSVRWVEGRARMVDGQPGIFDGTVFDIDERKRAELALLESQAHLVRAQAQLRESESRLRAMMQASPGLTWSARADGSVDFQSDATRRLFGLEPGEMLEDAWSHYIHPDHLDRVVDNWRRCVATGAPLQMEMPMRSADGAYHWFSFRAIAERDAAGRVVRWYGSGSDVDEFKRAQAAAESASRAKSAFLSTMSHEIRTPLTAVLGFAGLLADTELGVQQREFVNSIRASGDHLLGVINDILDFSKLESGSLPLEFAPCDIRKTVESALDLVASQAAAKRLELLCRIDDDVPAACIADQARLRQVLVNLLSNAVKFTLEGEVFVWVSARPLAADEHEFEFRVTDTGIGIAQDRLDRLFRDFSQVDDSVSRRFGGTGLGLAISKRLVEAHGGVMSVESRPGKGSTFAFRLPASLSQSPEAAPTVSPDILRSRRVLLVDDNRSNLDILVLQVQAWDMNAVALLDPTQAVEVVERAIARGRPFDLAILDHHMFALDGIELAKRLRAISSLPIILLTSLGTTLELARGAGADIAAAQTKPIHRSVLLEMICSVLASRTPAPAAAPREAPAMPKLKMLLAEDNLANRKVVQLLLRKIGYAEIDVAVDGVEAVEAVKARDYDVILMDVQMPNLDGLDATRRIRTEVAAHRQPQIIAMTANAMVEDRETCIAAGMDDYLAKPIVPEHLAQALMMAGERRGVGTQTADPNRRGSERRDAEARARRVAEQVLAGGGQMGELMRRIDWSETPLGPPYSWPQSLRTALSILLSQKHPIFLWWGRELVQFYNDAYRPILGSLKHPRAMGQRGRECWAEIWDVLGPQVDAAQRGESTMVERGLLCLDRHGFLEEAYFTYGLSPIRDETGGNGGVFVACSEHTADVIGARRNELLLELSARTQEAPDADTLWSLAGSELARACHDLPFVLIYREVAGGRFQLACATGLAAGSQAAPLELCAEDPLWPIAPDPHAREVRLVQKLAPRVPVVPPWPEPPHQALIHPLGASGVIVMGLSPRLPFDAPYRRFCERLALTLGRRLEALKDARGRP